MVVCVLATSVQAGPLTISQTIPDAFINDSIAGSQGQTYQLAASNPTALTSTNVAFSVDIPAGFSYVAGTLTNDAGLTPNVTAGDPFVIDFNEGLTLAPGDSINMTYRLATDCTAVPGQQLISVTANYDEPESPDSNSSLVTIKSGLIQADLIAVSPNPFNVEVGDTVQMTARISNEGEGSLFKIDFNANWGADFASPTLTGGTLAPTLSGDSYTVVTGEIPAGESREFTFELVVAGCDDLAIDVGAEDPCDPGTIYTDDNSPFLTLKQPNITIGTANASLDYCGTGDMVLTVQNLDNPAGTRGTAYNFSLSTSLPDNVNVDSVSAGWTHDGLGGFTLNGGSIAPGDTETLTIVLSDGTPCDGASGVFIFSPAYTNACGDPFAPPVVTAGYSTQAGPTIGLDMTHTPDGGDPERVFLNERVEFTITPSLTQADDWDGNIVITDVFPATLGGLSEVGSAVGIVDVDTDANTVTWTLTPAQAAASPSLTLEATTTDNACLAGDYISNTASITQARTDCGCDEADSDTARMYLQSKEPPAGVELDETKEILNTPAEGSFNVCPSSDVQYSVVLNFDAGSAGVWTNSYMQEDMQGGQVYVANSLEYDAGGGFVAVPGGNITSVSPLTVDLGFLTAVTGGDAVAGKSVTFQYELTVSNAALTPCEPTGSFLSETEVYVSQSTAGCSEAGGSRFFLGVQVPVSRAALDLGISLQTNSVSKSQPLTLAETSPVRVEVNKLTPWNANNVVVTVDTANYEYLKNPQYSGFGNQTPSVAHVGDELTFTFSNPLGAGHSGVITFDAVKTCSADYSISADLTFEDDCGVSCPDLVDGPPHSASDSPTVELQGDLRVNATPAQVQASSGELSWTFYITNKGSGTAYNVILTEELDKMFNYVSSTVDGAPAAPAEVNGGTTWDITWELGSLAPNQVAQVHVAAELTGLSCDFSNASTVKATYGFYDGSDTPVYTACETETAATVPIFTQPPSLMTLTNASGGVTLCGSGTINLTLKNNGRTHNYNVVATQNLGTTGLEYVPGSAKLSINGGGAVAIADPDISGADLTWTSDSGQTYYVAALEDMNIDDIYVISFEVNAYEGFNANQLISATANWEKPCERDGVGTGVAGGAGFDVPIDRPEITVTNAGWNVTAAQPEGSRANTVYGGQGDTVVWRVDIANNGTSAAQNVEIRDAIGGNFDLTRWADNAGFAGAAPFAGGADTDTGYLSIPDIPAGGDVTYYFEGTILADCSNQTNTAYVRWGCGNSPLTEPDDGDDPAYLVTVPDFSNAVNVTQAITNLAETAVPDVNGKVVITVTNGGGSAENLVLTNDLPTGFSIDTSAFTPTLDHNGVFVGNPTVTGSATVPIFTFDPLLTLLRYGESATLTFQIVQTGSIDSNENQDDRQETTGDGLDPAFPVTSNNAVTLDYENTCGAAFSATDNVSVNPRTPDLDIDIDPGVSIVRTVSGTGDTETFAIRINNRGDAAAHNGTLTVDVGSGFTVTGSGGMTDNGGGNYTLSLASINAGASRTITFNLTVANETDPLTFHAQVEGMIKDASGADIDLYSLDTIRARVIGFRMDKSLASTTEADSVDPKVFIGEDVTTTITATWFGFDGLENVSNITVTDAIPEGMGYLTHAINDPYSSVDSISGDTLHGDGNLVFSLADNNAAGTFSVDVNSRVLNDALNSEGAPNVDAHDLTDTASAQFTYLGTTYSTSTTGFTALADRQETVTVSTPSVSVTKQVRNMTEDSPSGAGNYAGSVSAKAGDTLEYSITITNAAGRAPAYDVEVSDTVNAKFQLMNMAVDGLDNDGDSITDGGDIGEQNFGGYGAAISFDDSMNAALDKLDPTDSVTFKYQVYVGTTVNPNETIQNTATVTYDTLDEASGSQTGGFEIASSLAAGAREYTGTDTAELDVDPVDVTGSKAILATSYTPMGAAAPFAGPQDVVIGEEVQYQLKFTVPPSTLENWVLEDTLPDGLTAIEGSTFALPTGAALFTPGGNIAPAITTSGGRSVITWNFGDQVLDPDAGEQTITINFIARVENVAGNQAGTNLNNTEAEVRYELNSVPQTVELVDVNLVVREPAVTITREVSPSTGVDAGDKLTVSITVENTSTVTAHNVRVTEDFTAEDFNYVAGEVGGTIPDTVDESNADAPFYVYDTLNAGQSKTFTYSILVDTDVQPQENLSNTSYCSWTSLADDSVALNATTGTIGADGAALGMRNGDIPGDGGLNDYEDFDVFNVALDVGIDIGEVTAVKADEGLVAGFPENVPGARHAFSITIDLPESTINDLVVTDQLNAGAAGLALENNATYDVTYTFTDILTVNGSAAAGFADSGDVEAALIAFAADQATGTVTWNFGTVITDEEDDTPGGGVKNPQIVINYVARIDNVADNQAGTAHENLGTVTYDNGETAATTTINAGAVPFTVLEPQLTVTKEGRNITRGDGDFSSMTAPDAGDILEFRVTIANGNTNAFTAYDINIQDSLPEGLALTADLPVGDVSTAPDVTGDGTAGNAETLVWGRTQATPLSIDLAADSSMQFTYQVEVLGFVEPGQEFANTVDIDWTSLSGANADERDGAGGVDDYTDSDSFTTTNRDDTTFAKARTSDTYGPGDNDVRIGDLVTFTLTIGLTEGVTSSLVVEDALPAGLAFYDTVSLNGDAAAPYSSANNFTYTDIPSGDTPATGQTGTVAWTMGDVTNANANTAGVDTFTIVYRARIADAVGFGLTPSTQTVSNAADLNYVEYDNSAQQLSDSVSLDIVQPVLESTKALAVGQTELVNPSGTVSYEITITNTGDAAAYNTVVADTLPAGMRMTAPAFVSATLGGAPVALAPLSFNAAAGSVSWTLSDAQAILPGESLVIEYQATVDDRVKAGTELTNQAGVVSCFSKESADPDERRQYPASAKSSATVTVFGMLFTPNHEQTTQAGTSIHYIHQVDVYAAGTTADLSFSSVSSQGLVWTVYYDTNGSGALDAGDARYTNGTSFATGEYTFFMRTVVPNQVTDGWSDTTVFTASLQSGPNIQTRTVTDITRVVLTGDEGAGEVTAAKEAAIDTDCDGDLSDELVIDATYEILKDAEPGECAIYRITFANQGTGTITNVKVVDDVVDYSTYVGGSAEFENTPAGLTETAITEPAGGAMGTVTWTYGGSLEPGLSGSVKYTVKIDE
ncbi:isopeptide-forming domain-containing fimbrial protein [Desulfatibacillum aliphaticivorans]|uniref:isopeptide-forming domain-containing fimbrial protein n=1 Tax=Desulfatibacillum aliphaticivorans TaxID=218208 RepID=UPI000482A4EB|nr:isopeptide-forming domain-containing fimbrial protein [Desulfatibacillum aliphaticivorans]